MEYPDSLISEAHSLRFYHVTHGNRNAVKRALLKMDDSDGITP